MRFGRRLLIAVLTVLYIPFAFAASVEGLWTTIDDKTGKPRSVVRLSESGGKLTGSVVNVYKQEGDTGKCSKCPGQFKDKPIKGLQFLWGLEKKNESTWTGGKILDPKSGKIYNAKITVKGNKLYVRGYVGMSMLGRTQVWVRK
ncbi:DUF2147 domain-containing protein [Legionella impletisoli]|uniref:DUF2147 domain-containing protein n=1 Tax=Legionella impletisoli TaxID=343510 RepID=A0A917JR28_9GAMM|nr:DUF2147 domain-containing protein [Legionella impletisoli]GGI80915.1 hypothetical protein GCM10007966_06770 [Legionella impletisoli]